VKVIARPFRILYRSNGTVSCLGSWYVHARSVQESCGTIRLWL
jgi:hypothetical protein